jgi:hypothetical protein
MERQVGQVDIDGEPGHIANKHVVGRTALKCKRALGGNFRKQAKQKRYSLAVFR